MYGKASVIQLPTGVKVRARRPSLISLLSSGGFPNELTTVVWNLYNQKEQAAELAQTVEGIAQLASLIEHYVPHVLVSPKVGPITAVQEGEDGVLTGTLSMTDIQDTDKQYLFLFGQRMVLTEEERQAAPDVAAALAPFRKELERLNLGSVGEAVQSAAVQPGGVESREPAGS